MATQSSSVWDIVTRRGTGISSNTLVIGSLEPLECKIIRALLNLFALAGIHCPRAYE